MYMAFLHAFSALFLTANRSKESSDDTNGTKSFGLIECVFYLHLVDTDTQFDMSKTQSMCLFVRSANISFTSNRFFYGFAAGIYGWSDFLKVGFQ